MCYTLLCTTPIGFDVRDNTENAEAFAAWPDKQYIGKRGESDIGSLTQADVVFAGCKAQIPV